MPVVEDWWESLRRVPPKEVIVALVSKVDILAAGVVKCLDSWESLDVMVVGKGELWRLRNRIQTRRYVVDISR